MSEQSRGPLIQRQGYVKRAPSGKLSAFRKWEKKWCVFALSKRCGPVLDFFDERSGTGSGPAGAIGRVELKATKQVCAAIQCKVPYTFIVVTESKILSLAALSQSDADSWISCLRRVLTNNSCLQSSEDHTYETSGNALTRQEQERLSRAKKRPPTPPGSESEEDYPNTNLGSPTPTAPPPLVRNSVLEVDISSAPPLLPKRATRKEVLPPPVPKSSRPRLKEPESPSTSNPVNNVLDVLRNYEESPDTTYEDGNRQAISNAANSRTLDSKMLASILKDYGDVPKSKTLVTTAAPPIYSRLNKKKDDQLKRPVVAPRRTKTVQRRAENDFAPKLSRQAPATPSSESDSDSSQDDMGVVLGELLTTNARDLDDVGEDAEDTYTCMDDMFDSFGEVQNVFPHLSSLVGSRDSDEDADRYMETPLVRTAVPSQPELSSPVRSSSPEQLKLPEKEFKSSNMTSLDTSEQPQLPPKESKLLREAKSISPEQSQFQAEVSKLPKGVNSGKLSVLSDSVYENSRTILSDTSKTPKAVPTAAPRRAATVSAKHGARSDPPKPSMRIHRPRSAVSELKKDEYENFLGEFGVGVSSKLATPVVSKSKDKTNSAGRMSSKLGRLRMGSQQSSVDTMNLPLPPTPEDNDPPALHSAQLMAGNIPLANGESSGSLASPQQESPEKSVSGTLNYDMQTQQTDTPSAKEVVFSIDNRNHLPVEEAPPPYTPPRILNNSQRDAGISCIIEGNSEEEEQHSKDSSSEKTSTNQAQSYSINRPEAEAPAILSYDSHPAFERSPKMDRALLVHNNQSACRDQAVYSPHTPPGTPPTPTRRKSAPARPPHFLPSSTLNSNNQSDEDVVIRLEDTFPKMKQSTRHRSSYLEDVVAVSPTSTGGRSGGKPGLRKSFSVNSPSWKNVDRFNFNLNTLAPVAPTKSPTASSLTVAEYDHVIRQRVAQGKRVIHSDSSSDEAEAPVVQRRPKKSADTKQRRKSAPPNSLPVPSLLELNAGAAKQESPPPVKPPKERRRKQPLDGGTLLREGKTFKAPARDSNNLPLKQAQTQLLQDEIAHSYGVKVTVWRKDVKYALFVDMMNFVWVAGWNQKERPLLQNVFHIGDKILSVNKEPFVSASKLIKMIKRSDSETKYEFVLRRLPFGKAYFVHRNLDYESIGLELKEDSAELAHIEKGGLVAKQGLRINPNKAFGSGQCHWVITEVNHRPLSLLTADSEASARLSAMGKDVSFVVQPMDFVELLKKTFKSSSSYKDFVVN